LYDDYDDYLMNKNI